jgi:hypothetical protein
VTGIHYRKVTENCFEPCISIFSSRPLTKEPSWIRRVSFVSGAPCIPTSARFANRMKLDLEAGGGMFMDLEYLHGYFVSFYFLFRNVSHSIPSRLYIARSCQSSVSWRLVSGCTGQVHSRNSLWIK